MITIRGTRVAARDAVFTARAQLLLGLALLQPATALAQNGVPTQTETTVCGLQIPTPASEPPPGSAPVIFQIVPCFAAQGNVSMVEPQTYLYYIHAPTSAPSQGRWVPYDETTIAVILEDFRRLWDTGFLDNLSIDIRDYPFANGVIGKLIVYQMEERQRIKIVNYAGGKHLEQSKLEEKLRDQNITIKLDSFLDQGVIAKVKTNIAAMLAEAGYPDAAIQTKLEAMPGGPKLVHLTFEIAEGPKIHIRQIAFDGNSAFSDRALRRAITRSALGKYIPFLKAGGTYKQSEFEDDAEALIGFYHNNGYISAKVGEPRLQTLEDSKNRRTRWVQLTIPVEEGRPYRIASLTVEGNPSVRSDYLLSLVKLHKGDVYSEARVRDGLNKARELYGSLGHFEFTGYPELKPLDSAGTGTPMVAVVLRMEEGAQYVVNRIEFQGNTYTKDNVIRRELRIFEGGVFNTEALKDSVRRLNQLGYFKPLEDQKDIHVEKIPTSPNKVNLTLKLQEQNRNQISFGAGLSEVNGLFVSASYATTNFLGQGETLQLAVEAGSRSNNYSAAVSEPFLLGHPISTGINLFSRKTDYLLTTNTVSYSEVREGVGGTIGFAVRRYARLFGGYTYEIIDSSVGESSANSTSTPTTGTTTTTPSTTATTSSANAVATSSGFTIPRKTSIDPMPGFNYALDTGRHIESRVEPTLVYNTVDNPLTPHRGISINLGSRVAGNYLGGTVSYVRPEAEGIWYIPHTKRTALGLRGQTGYLRPYGVTEKLPYYLRYFLGGENQIRGMDLRTVGPVTEGQFVGGNKFLLFNAEYYLDIAGPVRLLAFHDAGQAFDESQRFNLRGLRTSSGVELRVFMPVLNVPFRLIYAWNIYRDTFQKPRTFKFAVGTTF
jgi:outer membrane protein insertion porin family